MGKLYRVQGWYDSGDIVQLMLWHVVADTEENAISKAKQNDDKAATIPDTYMGAMLIPDGVESTEV